MRNTAATFRVEMFLLLHAKLLTKMLLHKKVISEFVFKSNAQNRWDLFLPLYFSDDVHAVSSVLLQIKGY